MTKTRLFILLVTLILFSQVLSAQSASNYVSFARPRHREIIKPVSVGDNVPDIEFNVINYAARTVRLSDFREKIVVLFFWSTWCGNCLTLLPKMDSIQEVYDEQLQIILVNSEGTGDSKEKIGGCLQKIRTTSQNFSLFSTVNDVMAMKLFPHTEVPYFVLISSSGTFAAGTNGINGKNIEDYIRLMLYSKR